jgi:hypothetical protein
MPDRVTSARSSTRSTICSMRVYAAYSDLPIESDALSTGNAVRAACLKWFDSSEPPKPS